MTMRTRIASAKDAYPPNQELDALSWALVKKKVKRHIGASSAPEMLSPKSFNRDARKAVPALCAAATRRSTPLHWHRGTRLIAAR